MKLSSTIIVLAAASTANAAFVSHSSTIRPSSTVVKGYLDDLNAELYAKDEEIDVVADSREANEMSKDKIDRFGPGNMSEFVDFDEFDGGDGQMGVAGDGQKGLDKSDFQQNALAANLDKSRSRSAKNAWGTSTGYADSLIKQKGMDTARAQQLENWHQQREISGIKKQQQYMADEYDKVSDNAEADWRTLAKFGVERNQEFDLNETFGAASIEGAETEGTIELGARQGGLGYHEFSLKNPYMGFADFRATFSPETGPGFTVDPTEGSLMQRDDTKFTVKFRAEMAGVSEGFLIIETEDFKKVWKVIGST
jgi:hypothetical protein